MIVMLISNASSRERQYLMEYTHLLAAKWSDEQWKLIPCATNRELGDALGERTKIDILCVDITMKGALELTKQFRQRLPLAYIILIASPRISPLVYMRPTIGAESLMLKPLEEEQMKTVLSEAVQTYVRRFYKPDETKAFVIEHKGGRELIDYEQIIFFEAREKRVYLNTDIEEYGFYDTLEQLEEKLSERFIRCHRSYLVNKSKITKIFLSQNRVVLKDGVEIPLSRSYKAAIKEYLAKEDINV